MNWVLVLLWCASANQYCVPVVMPAFYTKTDCPLVGKKAIGDAKYPRYFCISKTVE